MKRFCFSLLMTMVLLSVLEGLAWLWSPPHFEVDLGTQLRPHSTRIWALDPTTQLSQFGALVSVDDLGMRVSSGPQNGERWLIVGDSSFFGHGVGDQGTLHAQLSHLWSENGRAVLGQCGAVPGYSILQTRLWLNEVGWDLQPKTIVIGNLWSDNNFDHFRDKDWLKSLQQPSTRALSLLSHSRLFLWLSHQLRPAELERGSPHGKISWLRDPTATGQRRVALNDYAQVLSEIVEEAHRREVGVIIVQPANRYRVEGMSGEATWDPYFKAQKNIAEHYQVLIVDAAAVLSTFGIPLEQAFVDELHPSSVANRWIAQSIVSAVQGREQSLLPVYTSSWNEELKDSWESHAPFKANTGH